MFMFANNALLGGGVGVTEGETSSCVVTVGRKNCGALSFKIHLRDGEWSRQLVI